MKNDIITLFVLVVFSLSIHGQPRAVDLGLSVKWASYNVGAISPGDYGNFYAWGETESKEDYDWSTYIWCRGDKSSMIKYNIERGYGRVDGKTCLTTSDDVAHQEWGGKWRIPTAKEWKELCNLCDWTWTSQIGHNGYKVTSRRNGNSIFLPAAGCHFIVKYNQSSIYGRYWSSSLDEDYPYRAISIFFREDKIDWTGESRYIGLSIRPVCD